MATFSALVTHGGGKLRFLDGSWFSGIVAAFAEGEEIDLFMETASAKATAKQRRFFHGPVLKAFIGLGWEKADAKRELCLRYIPIDHHRPDGTVVTVPGHTSDLSVEEYDRLIESCIQLAAEMGEVVMNADEWRESRRAAA